MQSNSNSLIASVLLALFLATSFFAGAFIYWLNHIHFIFVFGWSRSPGPGKILVWAIFLLAAVAFWRREKPGLIVLSSVLYILSLCVDYWPDFVYRWLPKAVISAIWPLFPIIPVVFANYFVFKMDHVLKIQKFGFWFVGAYLQSIHIYNSLTPGQHMGVFWGGWIE